MSKHIKIFSGSSILVNQLVKLLDEINIPSFVKNNVESARLSGFVSFDTVELYIFEKDYAIAKDTIENFKKEINI